MKHYSWPPRFFLRLFRWFCHPKLKDQIEGDLIEVYNQQLEERGKRKADWAFITDVLLLFRPGIIKPMEGYQNLNQYDMFKSYFKIGFRNIIHQKFYAAINVFGLALGLCACIVIYVVTSYELSFDTFHEDRERIYRIMGDLTESTGGILHFNKLPVPVSQTARTQVSGLEVTAGLIPFNTSIRVVDGEKPVKTFESKRPGTNYVTTVIAERQYFEIFKYDWLAGNIQNAATALSVVLTEGRAIQYFGNESLDKIIGKQIVYEDSLVVTVSGIVKGWPDNSDLSFTDFISFTSLQNNFLKKRINTNSWKQGDMSTWVFAKLQGATTPEVVNAQLATILKTQADSTLELSLWLQPLSAIHFDANVIENSIRTAHLPTLYSLTAIAGFILLLAIINFINLSTAQSVQRAKEIGVRKVLGGSRASLTMQFLMETFLLTVFAVLIAIIMVKPVLNGFKTFISHDISFHLFKPSTLIFLGLVVLFTTIFAGLYPSRVLSSFLPAVSLKGTASNRNSEKWLLRKGLIVFQFTVSLVFIIGSIVISNQLEYTRKKDLGFTADAIVIVETPWGEDRNKIMRLTERVKRISGVQNVALQWVPPMALNGRGRAIKFRSTDDKPIEVVQVAGNEDFIHVYQIKLLAGRNLVRADSLKEFVINETLARRMGCLKPEEALGKMLFWDDKPYPVVGVVGDFHSRSFHEAITPLCLVNRPDREGTLAIKLASTGMQADLIKTTLLEIEKNWKELYPAGTFNYTFYDDSLALIYEKDQRTATLITISMSIAILLSCIGLFGLTLFTLERRAKEISIRKILGASISNITAMLSKDFVVLAIIALFIASPIAWYFANDWLQGFAYHVNISWDVFALAGASSVLITLVTISFQAIKAAVANPINSLKSE